MSKMKQKSISRSLTACALLLFAGLVTAPILSATGKIGANKTADVPPAAEPAPMLAAIAADTHTSSHRRLPTVRLSPSQMGDYDGAEYAGSTIGSGAFDGQGRPAGYGGFPATFTGTEIGAGAVPILAPRTYVHSGSARSGTPSSRGSAAPDGGTDNGQPGNPGRPTDPDQPTKPGKPGEELIPDEDIDEIITIPPIPPETPDTPAEVPEPSALVLLFIGLGGLVFARRRAH